MLFSLTSLEGEIEVNHQASPGFSPEQALKTYGPGQQYELFGEGKISRMPTRVCAHCGGCVVMNPKRERHRNHCIKCHAYICDICYEATTEPGYEHRPFAMIREMIMSGKWRYAGGPLSNPVLLPVIGGQDG
jgi:ribosomal protein S27AE